MGFPQRQAAVVGVYLTEQGSLPERTSFSLEVEAFKGALDDAGLKPQDVDGLVARNRTSPVGGDWYMYWAEQLGHKPLGLMEMGLGPGGIAKAALAVAAGMCEVAVFIHGQAGYRIGPKGRPMPTRAPRTGEWGFDMWGAYMSTWYALWAQRYMHEFGATSEQLAHVAVVDRYHATLNKQSIMGKRGPITVEDVINSRMITSPLHLLDCALDNDGGYAIVISSAERARDLKRKPVYILGGAESTYTDSYINIDKPWFPEEGKAVRRAADTAFNMAGISRDDIDVAGLYDCFTITTIRDMEEMGFCKLGEGADFVQGDTLKVGGKLPTNPHGGLLSCSHNGLPHGMFVVEVARQLRGDDVEPERQVKDAKIGVALGQGASVHGQAGVLVMATE